MANRNYTLILVGGTGQRVGLMLGYLNVLGLAAVPRSVIVVDADDQHRDTLTRLLSFGNPDTTVSYQKPFAAVGVAKVSSLVRPTGSKFWDICMEPADRDMPVSDGFYARPQVASVVFNASMAQPDQSNLFQAITKAATQGLGQKATVVLVGSISGGTGAGIIPTLARHIGGSARVAAVLFTRYFQLPGAIEGQGGNTGSFAPDNELIEANSNAGFEHVRDLLGALHCPFNAVYLLGHHPEAALAAANAHEVFAPHPFAGFLLAASLLADGSSEIDARIDAAAVDDGGKKPHLYVFPSGAKGVLNELQVPIKLPLTGAPGVVADVAAPGTTPSVNAATLRLVLLESGRAVQRLAAAPLARSLGVFATYPRQRLGPAVYDTLRERGALSAGEAKVLEQQLLEAASTHASAVEGVRQWFASLPDWKSSPDAATAVSPTPWRDALDKQTREVNTRLLAERWIQALSRGQIAAVASAKADDVDGRDILLPFQPTGGRDKVPCGPVEIKPESLEPSSAKGEHWEKLSRSYATPDGRREAFAIALRDDRAVAARELEWTLWQGVAAGLLGIEVVDCLSGPRDGFDYALYLASQQRFHLRLHAPDRAELGVGGISADGGVWPGAMTDSVQAALQQIRSGLGARAPELAGFTSIANPSEGLRAAVVLRMWAEDVVRSGVDSTHLPWLRRLRDKAEEVTNRVCRDSAGRVSWAELRTTMQNHIATAGPLRVDRLQGYEALYIYQFDAWRRSRIILLQQALAGGNLLCVEERIVTNDHTRAEVAHVQLALPPGRVSQDSATGTDVIFSGYARLRFCGPLPMKKVESQVDQPWQTWERLLRLDPQAYQRQVRGWHQNQPGRPELTSPFAPDLLWNTVRPRSGAANA